jgi:hypothetical protein
VKSADGAECHDEEPADFITFARNWRALWPEFFASK